MAEAQPAPGDAATVKTPTPGAPAHTHDLPKWYFNQHVDVAETVYVGRQYQVGDADIVISTFHQYFSIREIPDHATFRVKGVNTGLVRQTWGLSPFGPV